MRLGIFTLTILALTTFGRAVAQEGTPPHWKVQSDINLTLTQNAYSDNWAGGERGSMNWTLNSNTVAEKQILAKVYNQNTLKLAYGLTYNQNENHDWNAGEKSTDLVDLESTFRWTLNTFLEPIVAFRGITQFRDESSLDNKRWLNPLDLTESIGVAHVFVKEETREWQTRLGLAAKQTINRDEINAMGDKETLTQYDEGLELVNDAKTPLADDRIVWTSKLTVFQGILSTAKDDFKGTEAENYWRYPDVNFENIFTSQITKLLAVNLYVQLLYDRQIDRDARLKQTLSLALTYNLL